MSTENKSTETWIESTSELVETYRCLISIKLIEHASLGASLSIMGILSLVIGVFVLLFTGMGSAWWLGEYLSNMKAGFFIVGGVYASLLAILLITRKIWIQRIRNLVIKIIYEQD